MRIAGSNVLFSSQRQAIDRTQVKESLRFWNARPQATQDTVSISTPRNTTAARESSKAENDGEPKLDPKLELLKAIIERLLGREIKVFSAKELKGTSEPVNVPDANQAQPAQASQPSQPAQASQPAAGWGVAYDYSETHIESEQVSFAADGVVKTADGAEIKFTLQLQMSRVFAEETSVSLRLGDAARQQQDPLVINFGGTAAQLTDTKFNFDLNSDGAAENISFVSPNSGFLALDRNGDGKVTNGGELFGTSSGNGFKDLAALDADGNGWIDENDPAFAELRIWAKDGQGADSLSSLAQKDIGAIYLGNVSTDFALKDAQNAQQGQVRATGIFLTEHGAAGTVQQVDLAV